MIIFNIHCKLFWYFVSFSWLYDFVGHKISLLDFWKKKTMYIICIFWHLIIIFYNRSDSYRMFLWLFAIVALLGNLSSILVRTLKRRRKSSNTAKAFNLFVSSLSIADSQMGIYLSVIGIADQVFKGSYLWQDVKWKSSTMCQVSNNILGWYEKDLNMLSWWTIILD